MLSTLTSILIVFAIVAASVAFLAILNWWWPAEQRRQHNDIVGWQIAVIGTIFGVVIGFQLFVVWTQFEDARLNVGAEANALVNLSRISSGLPQGQAVQKLVMQYAGDMVVREWPAMRDGRLGEESGTLTRQLWRELMQPEQLDQRQQLVLGGALTAMAELTRHRRERQIQSREHMPGILWAVLIVGEIVTITSSCIYGAKSFALHVIQVVGLAALTGLALMAVAEISRPFQGSVHVEPDAFVYARQAVQADQADKLF